MITTERLQVYNSLEIVEKHAHVVFPANAFNLNMLIRDNSLLVQFGGFYFFLGWCLSRVIVSRVTMEQINDTLPSLWIASLCPFACLSFSYVTIRGLG